MNLWGAPRRDRSVPQIFTVASFGVFIFGRIQPFSGHKALFLMGFLPFCVKPLAPLALEAVGTVGTVGTSNGKPVRARLSKGLCCSHSQFTKWEQWEHPSLFPLLLPCLPNAARKGAPRPLPPVGLVLAPAKRGAESAPGAPPSGLTGGRSGPPLGLPLARRLHGRRRPAGRLHERPASRRPEQDLLPSAAPGAGPCVQALRAGHPRPGLVVRVLHRPAGRASGPAGRQSLPPLGLPLAQLLHGPRRPAGPRRYRLTPALLFTHHAHVV